KTYVDNSNQLSSPIASAQDFLLTSGPAEMTLSSIGYVVDAYDPSAGLISIATPLLQEVGGRLTFLTLAPFTYCLVCLGFGLGGKCLWLLSLFTGICYGTLFALAPSLVAIVWPLKSFGRNFGIISYFAATGSFLFTLVFGILFEEEPVKRHGDINTIIRVAKFQKSSIESVQKVYRLSFLSELIALVLILVLYKAYWSKKKKQITRSYDCINVPSLLFNIFLA
ncbi:hypothetical protein BY996DRAFT_8210893, partial [Phakopsora pachyrhizi]